MGWEVQCLHLPPSETPRAAVPMPGDAQRHPASARAVGAGERAGSAAFCCCRVIYDMRESHCLDPSCIFPRALPLFPDPRCAPATVRLLWGCSPCRGYAGSAGEGCPPRPDPSRAPSPLPQPSRPAAPLTCRGPGNGAFGPSKFTATGGIQLPEGRGGGSGIWGVWLHSPFPFSAGSVLGAYRSPVPFSS